MKHTLKIVVGSIILLESLTSFNLNMKPLAEAITLPEPKIETFSQNPFKTPTGDTVYAKFIRPDLTAEYLKRAIDSAESKQDYEKKILVNNFLDVITIRDSLNTDSINKRNLEFKLLPQFSHAGKQAKNPKSKFYYPILNNFNLKDEDCTLYVLDALAKTHRDTMYQHMYNYYAEGKYELTEFPKVFANYLHNNGYATIFVAQNTKSEKREERYPDGSRRGGLTKLSLSEIKSGTYYAPIDYIITDEDLQEPATREFIKSTPKIVTVHENYHMGFDDKGTFLEAHRDNNPALENVYEESNFYKGLLQEGTRNWKNAVLFVPESEVQEFLATRIEKK